ncbi:MAG: FG-GAP-like repeat-containing protein [Terracidiphilus sp.]|jgi:phage tail tube protein FII
MFPRRSWLTAVVAAFVALPAFTQTNFSYQAYPTPDAGGGPLVVSRGHVADFNGDGFADVVQASNYVCSNGTCQTGYGLTIYLNNGSGGLDAGQALNVFGAETPAYSQPFFQAIGDFNGDGKLDIAVLHGSGLMSILYGNGDGTFAAPVLSNLPSGNYSSLVAADFDVNGTQDLAALNQNGQLVLLLNDGKGNFTSQTVTLDTPPGGATAMNLTVGDFNGDGRPDLAWAEEPSDGVSRAATPVMSALNTSTGVFSDKQQVGTSTVGGFVEIVSADLDLDGKSDLIIWTSELDGCCSGFPQTLYYSNGDGTFTGKELATIEDAFDVEVADSNGDGNPDVLISAGGGIEIYTGNGDRTFTDQGSYSSLPGGAGQMGLGFFTGSNAVGFAAPTAGTLGTMTPPDDSLFVVANDNTQESCQYPPSPGVTFCSAMQNGNVAQVRGTARAQTQPVREIQLWANGKELYHVESDEFNATLDVAPGTPITAVEVEANGKSRSASVTPGSVQTCSAPASPGVNVCSPTQGESVASPVTVIASGTGASGSVNHLELWIDGTKIGNYSGATMNASVPLAVGSHALTVIEVDSNWNYVKSTVVNITVGGTSGGCAAPNAPGVNVCSPTQGETVSSPLTVTAAGTGASGTVNHLELWIDGTKIGDYSGATMNAKVPLPVGSHAVTVIEVDSKGAYIKSNVVNVTVEAGSCGAPSSPGVTVCSPAQGVTVESPVTVTAAGKGASGTVNHLELWIDGAKIGDYSGATMNASVPLPVGSHAVTVIEVDSQWNYVKSNVINVVVK